MEKGSRKMKTNWDLIRVCNNCLSKRIKGSLDGSRYCAKCGHTGIQLVLMRHNFSLFKIKKEYKKYSNYANPFDKQ